MAAADRELSPRLPLASQRCQDLTTSLEMPARRKQQQMLLFWAIRELSEQKSFECCNETTRLATRSRLGDECKVEAAILLQK
jgi:hypothetical protein